MYTEHFERSRWHMPGEKSTLCRTCTPSALGKEHSVGQGHGIYTSWGNGTRAQPWRQGLTSYSGHFLSFAGHSWTHPMAVYEVLDSVEPLYQSTQKTKSGKTVLKVEYSGIRGIPGSLHSGAEVGGRGMSDKTGRQLRNKGNSWMPFTITAQTVTPSFGRILNIA